MSARVVNPFSLHEMRRLREAVAARPATFRPDPDARARVCRNLYGKASADDSRSFAARELAQQRERAAERWGFDFIREKPRSHGPGAERFKWTRVRIGTVPAAYKMPRMPALNLDAVLQTARATVPSLAAPVREVQPEQPEASVTAEASSPIMTPSSSESSPPTVPMAMASPEMTNTTPSSSTPALPAPVRQTAITDFLVCRKRPLSRKAEEAVPSSKRARSQESEASRV